MALFSRGLDEAAYGRVLMRALSCFLSAKSFRMCCREQVDPDRPGAMDAVRTCTTITSGRQRTFSEAVHALAESAPADRRLKALHEPAKLYLSGKSLALVEFNQGWAEFMAARDRPAGKHFDKMRFYEREAEPHKVRLVRELSSFVTEDPTAAQWGGIDWTWVQWLGTEEAWEDRDAQLGAMLDAAARGGNGV